MAGFPSFYNPKTWGLWKNREPRIVLAESEGIKAGLRPAIINKIRRLLMIIDPQNDFAQKDGALSGPGGLMAMRILTEMLLRYPEFFAAIWRSKDEHSKSPHIFDQPWWWGPDGSLPEVFTQMIEEVVSNGTWKPRYMHEWSLGYPAYLRKTGQAPLTIWSKHCVKDTPGAEYVPELVEAMAYVCAGRGITPIDIIKGIMLQTEHYGPFAACRPVPGYPESELKVDLLHAMFAYDEIWVCGLYEDYCVREGLKQMIAYIEAVLCRPDLISKIHLIRDCTALVFPDKQEEADGVLEGFEKKGMKVVSSADIG